MASFELNTRWLRSTPLFVMRNSLTSVFSKLRKIQLVISSTTRRGDILGYLHRWQTFKLLQCLREKHLPRGEGAGKTQTNKQKNKVFAGDVPLLSVLVLSQVCSLSRWSAVWLGYHFPAHSMLTLPVLSPLNFGVAQISTGRLDVSGTVQCRTGSHQCSREQHATANSGI